VTDSLVTPGVPEPLEERLAGVLPRLEAHLARHARRLPGVEPEDVAQEVVVRALRYRASYDERRALWPWLRSVAEHVLHDHRAAGARQPTSLDEHELAAPDRTAIADTREELELLLAALRPVEPDVLLRFHLHVESVREIALATGLPEGTVKSHLSRARRRLAELSDCGGER